MTTLLLCCTGVMMSMPFVVNAECEYGIFREAGVQVSMARTTHGGEFIEQSPAARIPIHGMAMGGFARFELAR